MNGPPIILRTISINNSSFDWVSQVLWHYGAQQMVMYIEGR